MSNRQSDEIKRFMLSFKPETKQDFALFMFLKEELRHGINLCERITTLAKIGDAELLRCLYDSHRGTEDYFVRKLILENKKCPMDVILDSLWDNDWEVRKAAILRPELSHSEYVDVVCREKNPRVVAALKQRLGEEYYDLIIAERRPVKMVGVEIEDNRLTHSTVIINLHPRLDNIIRDANHQKDACSCDLDRPWRVVNTQHNSREG